MSEWFPVFLSVVGGLAVLVSSVLTVYQQKAKSDELARKNAEIAELTREALSTATGGDSFAHVDLLLGQDPRGPVTVLVQRGKYPLYDLSIRVVDVDLWNTLKPEELTIERLATLDTNITAGNMAAGSTRVLGRWATLKGHSQGFNLFFAARNGFWTQLIRLKLVDGQWKMATKVVRNEGQPAAAILHEEIHSGFPKNSDGEVDWR